MLIVAFLVVLALPAVSRCVPGTWGVGKLRAFIKWRILPHQHDVYAQKCKRLVGTGDPRPTSLKVSHHEACDRQTRRALTAEAPLQRIALQDMVLGSTSEIICKPPASICDDSLDSSSCSQRSSFLGAPYSLRCGLIEKRGRRADDVQNTHLPLSAHFDCFLPLATTLDG